MIASHRRSVGRWLGLVFVVVPAGWAFPGVPRVPSVPSVPGVRLPSLEDIVAGLIKEDPPVSTTLDDALTAIPWLGEVDPAEIRDGLELPREEDGSWLVPTGVWQFTLESYCLHAGSWGPGGGEGYLLAPLKGSRAGAIGAILNRTWRVPDLLQSRVQSLIWAIESRTRLDTMPPEMQETARLLLEPEELKQLNAATLFDQLGGKGGVPDDLLRRIIAKLPAPLQASFAAQAKIHNMIINGSPTYDQLVAVAMLAGNAPGGAGEVPAGEWSWHPDRYLIRFFPNGHRQTVVQVMVPPNQALERDSLGRIITLMDEDGWTVRTTYDDTIEPFVAPEAPGVIGYTFKSIVLTSPDPDQPGATRTAEFDDVGWTFVGVPDVEARTASAASPLLAGWAGPSLTGWTGPGGWGWYPTGLSSRLANWEDRYGSVKDNAKKVNETRKRLEKARRRPSNCAVSDLTDLGHYRDGLKDALDTDNEKKLNWIGEHLARVQNAWRWATNKLAGDEDGDGGGGGGGNCNPTPPGPGGPGRASGGHFGGGGVATPGNRYRQRLGMSQRGSG